jgi:acyl carrier protein
MGDNEQNLHAALMAFLKSLKGDAASNLDDNTPLFTSGLIDSLVLLQLSLWIEENVGAPVNPAEYDLAREWETVAGIVSFIERLRTRRISNE